MSTITVNTSDYELRRAREGLLGDFIGALDAKRPAAWQQYGYDQEVSFAKLKTAYDRNGAGFGAVHRILDKCWEDNPRIKSPASDKETPWEVKVNALMTKVGAWAKLADFDRRNLIGRYSALIYRIGDNKALSEELGRGGKLVDLIPVDEDQIKVKTKVEDRNSPDYGKPTMFEYRAKAENGESWVDVHPSRVQFLAEGSVGDFEAGVPLLRAGFNLLVDIEKLSGGGAESALKNSARTIVFEYNADANIESLDETGKKIDVRGAHEELGRALNRNQDSTITMQGGKASTLQTQIGKLGEQFEISANLFAASVQLPFTILFGQQTGRLASDQDRKDYAARCGSRRAKVLTPMLTEFVTRMQAAAIIDAGEFEIEWPPIDAPSDSDKLDLLNKMVTAMKGAFDAGLGMPMFTLDELRKVAGFEKINAQELESVPPVDPAGNGA